MDASRAGAGGLAVALGVTVLHGLADLNSAHDEVIHLKPPYPDPIDGELADGQGTNGESAEGKRSNRQRADGERPHRLGASLLRSVDDVVTHAGYSHSMVAGGLLDTS